MNYLRKHWYDIGMICGFIEAVILYLHWQEWSHLRSLALLNLIILHCKQFEEYRFPGGMPAAINMVLAPQKNTPMDRYPLNQHSAFFMNLTAIIAFILPVIFHKALSLTIMPILFGMLQVFVHCIVLPKRLRMPYAPGMISILFGHIPLGLYWFSYTAAEHWLDWTDIARGIIYLVLFIAIFTFNFGYGLFQSVNTRYPFTSDEIKRGGIAARAHQLRSRGQL